jgi:hypothetical protein
MKIKVTKVETLTLTMCPINSFDCISHTDS